MEPTNTATFQLKNFTIPNFKFEVAPEELSTLDIRLNPSGLYNSLNGEFTVLLHFTANAFNPKDKEIIKEISSGLLKAEFMIDGVPNQEDIPEYFYSNSLGIIFPYLRAFLSNITLQTGTRLIVLPLLNLTSLASKLIENTTVLE